MADVSLSLRDPDNLSQLLSDLPEDISSELEGGGFRVFIGCIVLIAMPVLQSIFGEDALRLWRRPSGEVGQSADSSPLRLELSLNLPDVEPDISVQILVSLDTETYPSSSHPQLQLLSRYIGPYGVDSELFGAVLRTYISQEGIEFIPGTVCLFDGLQSVLERCSAWYTDRLTKDTIGELMRDEERNKHTIPSDGSRGVAKASPDLSHRASATLPLGVVIHQAEAINDRKSSFVGRACAISHPDQIPLVLEYLSADRRIARAAHPIINAWRCQVDGLQHQDNDDDGETAAGGRIAHLLQILEVNNVLVVVTRYFGGIHLGPDRFKHINQAARNALEIGGFLEAKPSTKSGRK